MSDVLNALPPALLVVVGFVAGGALVALTAGLLPGSGEPGLEVRPIRSSALVEPGFPEAPAGREPTPSPNLRVPTETPRSTALDPIDGDSLATLVEVLRDRGLEVPVRDVDADELRDDFDDPRSGGRTHEALDILAPRGTPVIAVEDGTIAGLDPSQGGGGIVAYQFDPTGEFVYYYAHLGGLTEGLVEGQAVKRGDVLGFVGSSGNAPPGTPHLHFAIAKTQAPFRPHGGTPINPFAVLH